MRIRFHMNQEQSRVQPLLCGRRDCPPRWHVDRENVSHYLFHYILRGSGTLWKNGKTYSLKANDLYLMSPGQSAVYESSADESWEYCWIAFHATGSFEEFFDRDVIHLPEAARLFIKMNASENEAGREWKITGLIYQLIGLIAQQYTDRTPQKSYVDLTVDYIEKHYQEDFQVSTLSDRLGLNRSYFCRMFKNQTGMSPQDYLIYYRLGKAEKLLLNTELTQKEIAKSVGYPDIYAFSRMFKRKYGVAPGAYRSARQHMIPKPLVE